MKIIFLSHTRGQGYKFIRCAKKHFHLRIIYIKMKVFFIISQFTPLFFQVRHVSCYNFFFMTVRG